MWMGHVAHVPSHVPYVREHIYIMSTKESAHDFNELRIQFFLFLFFLRWKIPEHQLWSNLYVVNVLQNVLQCAAGCCRVLQGAAVWWSVLLCAAVCCSVLYISWRRWRGSSIFKVQRRVGSVLLCAALYWSVMQHVAACCSVLHSVIACCSVMQCVAVCCSPTEEDEDGH